MGKHRIRRSPGRAVRVAGVAAASLAVTAGLATTASAASAATPETGDGSVTLSITEPVSLSGTAAATVDCSAGRLTYTASASTATIDGYTLSFNVLATGYRGPGSYTGVLTLQLTQPDGSNVTLPAGAVPTSISATGGVSTVDLTTPAGTAIDGSLAWTCS
ncbi:hypothetical protein [Frankia sp. CiP3]|uniref:hypothetical protein n=1 Tax=Frankia sp. CiP3 TaxID=2880971 RepID=UPI001EF43C84|nr:hypothetical protein [Frankia sp. CiP3]